uniref:Uncharacterized protein n=1 Tax=Arundo donax TaxID=35708 RepID=A0A0A9FBT1_ARUDO
MSETKKSTAVRSGTPHLL